MKILITGNKGFIGRHFEKRLSGNDIVGVDIKDGRDCRDLFKTDTTVYDLIIHCAAVIGGRAMIDGDPISVATDLSIDAEMFNWAVKTKQKRIVYFSSSAAYPISYQQSTSEEWRVELKEDMIDLKNIKNPDMTYGWAKLTGEYLAIFAREKGVKVHVFRPFSGYGEDQDLDYPFPSFIQRGKNKENPFVIWGTGEQTRDFIHVDDIVEAVLKAIELEIEGPVNLGTGIATSFNDLAQMVASIVGYEPTIKHLTEKPVGVMYRVADVTMMETFYKPKISILEGIKRSL